MQILAIAKQCHYPLWYPEPLDYRDAITTSFHPSNLQEDCYGTSKPIFPQSSTFIFFCKFSCFSPALKLCQWISYHGDGDLGVLCGLSIVLNWQNGHASRHHSLDGGVELCRFFLLEFRVGYPTSGQRSNLVLVGPSWRFDWENVRSYLAPTGSSGKRARYAMQVFCHLQSPQPPRTKATTIWRFWRKLQSCGSKCFVLLPSGSDAALSHSKLYNIGTKMSALWK